ncbi:hypothetical protein M569_13107 [Genlisea aurea]|uniref:Uncharacterized protein n=1 Tax=Genlisea aurea TaxID=192259 RepID=S8CBD7_9LAMI|nr:hypothetical protein M569_13107 [Genlisea aurea]
MESHRKTAPRFSGLIRRRAPSPEAQLAASKSAPVKKSWAAPWGFVSRHIQKSMSRTGTHFCDFADGSDEEDGGTEEEKEKDKQPQAPLKSCLRKRESSSSSSSSSSRVSFNHNNNNNGIHPERGVDFAANDPCQGALACRIRNQHHHPSSD